MKRSIFATLTAAALAGLVALAGTHAFAQTTRTAKECRDEWRANKADNQAKGITEKTYITQCRAGTASAQPSTPPAATPAAAPAATAPAAPAPRRPAATTASAPAGSTNEFTTEVAARSRCPADTVVWVNLKSRIYHFGGHKDYGTTKEGTYMCERDTASIGARAAKGEKHP